jgi:aminopeptidase-like protein
MGYMSMSELKQMNELFDRLFPLFRSITGEGVRQTISILQEYMPLEIEEVPSGTQVHDWIVPKEWIIREAWIKDSKGNEILNMANSNLHVLNYSEPINKMVTLDELKEHLYTLPRLPDAIPYVTSYYKERWGFCMTHDQFESLEEDQYHVYINSTKIDGGLSLAQAVLPGATKKEILISSYICHPSMANNELSGPIVAAFLFQRLQQWGNREFTYRFVFYPETIGSITYLARHGEHLKKNLYSGIVLTCLGGDNKPLNYKMSRNEAAPLNRLIKHLVQNEQRDILIRPFTPLNGSDERQYCSPGYNLPVGQLSRMVYGQYAGYHNSLDTKEGMTIEALLHSVNEIEEILKLQELDGYYLNMKPYGEPMLGKYDLYPTINSPSSSGQSNNEMMDKRKQLNQTLMILSYSDQHHTLADIASMQKYPLKSYASTIKQLIKSGLLGGPLR